MSYIKDKPLDRVIILGGGYSVKQMSVDVNDLTSHGLVIGVNDSGLHAKCDVTISMDRIWMENRIDHLRNAGCTTWLRDSAWRKNLKGQRKWPGLYFFENDHQSNVLSDQPDTLNGFNSGICAINLAYHWKPRELFIFGFDMKRLNPAQAYWYPAYDWVRPQGNTTDKGYEDWAARFLLIDRQLTDAGIRTVNVSPKSAITNFEKMDYQGFLACVR